MELDPKYCDVAVTRWEQYSGKRAELVRTESVARAEVIHADGN